MDEKLCPRRPVTFEHRAKVDGRRSGLVKTTDFLPCLREKCALWVGAGESDRLADSCAVLAIARRDARGR